MFGEANGRSRRLNCKSCFRKRAEEKERVTTPGQRKQRLTFIEQLLHARCTYLLTTSATQILLSPLSRERKPKTRKVHSLNVTQKEKGECRAVGPHHPFFSYHSHSFVEHYLLKTHLMPRMQFVSEVKTDNESGTIPTLMHPTALRGVRLKQSLHR